MTTTAAGSAAGPSHALGAGLLRLLGTGNLALSPYSIAAALGMALHGARGETQAEMLKVLGASSVDEVGSGVRAVGELLERIGPPPWMPDAELSVDTANRIFGQRRTPWARGFLDALTDRYGAPLEDLDFVGATEAARKAINSWTAERTRGRIEEIVPTGGVDAMTRLVLVNALYLKAPWTDRFARSLSGDFELADGSSVTVPTMCGTLDHASLGSGDGWVAVRMPYVGDALAMTVVLPDEGRLADLETLVAAGRLPDVLPSVEPQPVDLAIPRWTMRSELSLGDALAALGMPSAFGPRADFSGMTTTDEPLAIDAVFHQVFVAVDEDGTEAAAATATAIRATSLPPPAVPVVVDRPFLFVIHDLEHHTPLFLGRVTDPRA